MAMKRIFLNLLVEKLTGIDTMVAGFTGCIAPR